MNQRSNNPNWSRTLCVGSLYLLHCWQNLCSWPPTSTTGVFEWASQTLCRRWYSRHLLKSAWQPSTKQEGVGPPLPCVRGLFGGPEEEEEGGGGGAIAAETEALDWNLWLWAGPRSPDPPPSFRSTEQSVRLPPEPPNPGGGWGLWFSTSAKSQGGILRSQSIKATTLYLTQTLFVAHFTLLYLSLSSSTVTLLAHPHKLLPVSLSIPKSYFSQ